MADGPSSAVVEAPKPQPIKRIEALAFGGDSGISEYYLSPAVIKAQDRARQLREQRERGLSDKDVLQRERARQRHASYNTNEEVQLARRLGAGYFQGENGNLTLGQDAPELARASFREGKEAMEQVGTVALYVDVVAEAQRRGVDLDNVSEIQRMLGARGSREQYHDLRERALDSIVAAVQTVVPEFSAMTAYEQRVFVEAAIAKDPEFQTKILQGLRDVEQRAAGLEDVDQDPEIKQLKGEKTATENTKGQALGKIESSLRDIGITVDEQLIKGIADAIEQGRSVDYVVGELRRSLFTEARFGPGLRECQESEAVDIEIADLEKWMKENTRTSKESVTTSPLGQEVLGEKQARYKALNATRTNLNNSFSSNPTLAEAQTRYKMLKQALGHPTEQGQYAGVVRANVEDVMQAQTQLKTIDRKIAEKEPAAKRKQEISLSERLRNESEIISELSGVVENAVLDVLIERHDEMVRLEQVRLEQLAETKAKAGEELTAESIRKVQKKIDGNWVSYDEKSRKRKIDRRKIGKDMKFAAYHGEEGIKRLILRDLELGSLVTVDSSGNIINSQADWETVDLSSLSKEGRELLDKVYESCGGAYRDRLFTDYFISRSGISGELSATFGAGSLNIKSHEWELLNRHFGETFEGKMSNSKNGQEVLKAMKEKGIVPSSKSKLFMYLLLLLGVGATALLGPAGLAASGAAGAALVGKEGGVY